MPSETTSVFAIADRYVDEVAALDPIAATIAGIPGHDHELTDYSSAGAAGRADLARRTLAALKAAPRASDGDRIAADVMTERLELGVEQYEAGERLRDVRVIGSPVQSIRSCFDLMAHDTDADWSVIAARIEAVPDALASVEAALREGLATDVVAARRQALACAQQAETWSGDSPFFVNLVSERPDEARLAQAAEAATAAYGRLGAFLRDEYAPQAEARDPVGHDRYALFARAFNGIELDLVETYAWGWEELYRIEDAMRAVGERILPGEPLPRVFEHLDADPDRVIDGVDEFRRWNQNLIDTTIAALDRVHFDIAEPLHRCEAMIAPPGGAAAMYYTGPSEDFSRPGRTWYPTLGKTRFPLWREVSICYHEAVPGHHLQVAQVRYLADRLSRFQRAFGFVSGHGEGWALYAERLMAELGYLDDPAWEMGMLSAQAMRAVRVIVDIGMHLELPSAEHDDAPWTADLALPFVIERSCFPESFMRSEVDRYLGWPGQAISYKVGERVWLEARANAQARHGADFDLKAFHSYALDLGSMGLGPLQRELARF
ncbi:MAG: DUF885 domain-containing protein [Actinomycetota bacterium]